MWVSISRAVQWSRACDRRASRSATTGPSILPPDDAQMDAAWCCSLLFAMRTTVKVDDQLLARAEQLCGPLECSALLMQALQALVQRESAKRLAAPWAAANPALIRCGARRQTVLSAVAGSPSVFPSSTGQSYASLTTRVTPSFRPRVDGWHGELLHRL